MELNWLAYVCERVSFFAFFRVFESAVEGVDGRFVGGDNWMIREKFFRCLTVSDCLDDLRTKETLILKKLNFGGFEGGTFPMSNKCCC